MSGMARCWRRVEQGRRQGSRAASGGRQKQKNTRRCLNDWLRGPDLNRRPSGYEPDELPGCSTPRPSRHFKRHFTLSLPQENWLRGPDLNRRPSGYEPDELPGCSTPRPWKRTILSMRFDATPFCVKKAINRLLAELFHQLVVYCTAVAPEGRDGFNSRRPFAIFALQNTDEKRRQ